MVDIARALGRRDLGRQVERRLGKTVDGAHLLVVDAIDEGSGNGEPPTVGKIALLLDVHPSRASRMVKHAIRAGLAARVASQGDGRKSCIELSAWGHEIARAIRGARARYFASRMKGWSRADRRNFARLLVLFAQSEHARHGGRADNDNLAVLPDPGGTSENGSLGLSRDGTRIRPPVRSGNRNRRA
ncbi:MAG TPA: MarR family transcriptional regulator [Rhizomicrobium sp.]|jgi:DNA-binding MarR family transcriptional regulator|nr:MarR family transcriptional regulator [Rhizomicrobium sp.]